MRESRLQLADVFNDYLKGDIYEIAKRKGLKGISKSSKEELIAVLTDHMCREEEAARYFSCLLDEQIEEFEKAAEAVGLYVPLRRECLNDLYAGAYIGVVTDGRIQVPEETAELYRAISNEAFHEKRKRISSLLASMRVSGYLYGIAPLEIVLKIVNQMIRPQMTEAELMTLVEEIPSELKEHVIVGDHLYHESLYPNDRNLTAVQNGKEFYIPTPDEVRDFNMNRYFSNEEETMRFKLYLVKTMKMTVDEAEEAASRIQRSIGGAEDMREVVETVINLGIGAETIQEAEHLMKLVRALWNHNRMLIHRGFTLSELEAKRSNVNTENKTKKSKIYPNDPCPCGSGKKYKNCCRNK